MLHWLRSIVDRGALPEVSRMVEIGTREVGQGHDRPPSIVGAARQSRRRRLAVGDVSREWMRAEARSPRRRSSRVRPDGQMSVSRGARVCRACRSSREAACVVLRWRLWRRSRGMPPEPQGGRSTSIAAEMRFRARWQLPRTVEKATWPYPAPIAGTRLVVVPSTNVLLEGAFLSFC